MKKFIQGIGLIVGLGTMEYFMPNAWATTETTPQIIEVEKPQGQPQIIIIENQKDASELITLMTDLMEKENVTETDVQVVVKEVIRYVEKEPKQTVEIVEEIPEEVTDIVEEIENLPSQPNTNIAPTDKNIVDEVDSSEDISSEGKDINSPPLPNINKPNKPNGDNSNNGHIEDADIFEGDVD